MAQFNYLPGTTSGAGASGAPDLAQLHFEQTMQKLEKLVAEVDAIKNEVIRIGNDLEILKHRLPH